MSIELHVQFYALSFACYLNICMSGYMKCRFEKVHLEWISKVSVFDLLLQAILIDALLFKFSPVASQQKPLI